MKKLLMVVLTTSLLISLGAECEAPTALPGVPGEIIIRYSATTATHIGFFTPQPGYTYLIVDLEIENRGYESFSTGHWWFDVIVERVKYSSTATAFLTQNSLKDVDLLDGGKVSGRIAFEVPEDVMSLGYDLIYDGLWDYNVEWIRQ